MANEIADPKEVAREALATAEAAVRKEHPELCEMSVLTRALGQVPPWVPLRSILDEIDAEWKKRAAEKASGEDKGMTNDQAVIRE